MNADRRRAAEAESLEMMHHPDRWPNNPALPVKRYREPSRSPECGLILLNWDGSVRSAVHLVNLWDLDKGGMLMSDGSIRRVVSVDPATGIKDMVDVERLEYDSLEALVADGWIVD